MEELDDSMDDVLASMDMSEMDVPSTSKEPEKEASKPVEIKNAEKEIKFNSNAVQVHPNQKGNPLLKSVTNVPWEYNETIVPDYLVGKNGNNLKILIIILLPKFAVLSTFSLCSVPVHQVSQLKARLHSRETKKAWQKLSASCPFGSRGHQGMPECIKAPY